VSKPPERKVINLALQGGGSHSAFTWGVLDRLLEDERLTFDGITATGAGSINAVVLADGLASGGREAASEHLETFWRRMSEIVSTSIIAPSFFDKMNPTFGLEYSPGYLFALRVAGCATSNRSAGHASAQANLKLTFHLDYSVGADHTNFSHTKYL
jgi:predicted acylesterase/phospholipase RssA